MNALEEFRKLPQFTRSTLPDARSMPNVPILCSEANGLNSLLLSYNEAWQTLLRQDASKRIFGDMGAAVNAGATGTYDITTYPGVVTGIIATQAARQANGVALQAAFDYCVTNGLIATAGAVRFDYEATGVQNGFNVGLQMKKTMLGFVGAGDNRNTGTRFVQYASNHPALTIGDVGSNNNDITSAGVYTGFAAGYGATQAGQTQALGILFGRIVNSTFDAITVDKFISGGAIHPYVSLQFGPAGGVTFFFSNRIGRIGANGGQLNIFRMEANTTGNTWGEIYLGGGGVGDRVVLTGQAMYCPTMFNLQFGDVAQLNIEWCQSPSQFLWVTGEMSIGTLHMEGNKPTGFFQSFIHLVGTCSLSIKNFQLLNNWITSAAATGTPQVVDAFGDSRCTIEHLFMQWAGGSELVCDEELWIFNDNSTVLGRKPIMKVGDMSIIATGLTGIVRQDQNVLGAVPGAAGAMLSHGGYQFHRSLSLTDQASITMGDANMTVYGAHSRCQVNMGATLTANRTLTLSDKMAASGPGSASVRQSGDIVTVVRTGAGAFNLIVANQSGTTLNTFTGAGSANTDLLFEWSGSAWSAL